MADDNRILVQIELDDGSVREGFIRIQNEGKSTFQKIGEVAAGVFAGNVISGALRSLKDSASDLFRDAVKSASDADQSVQRLNSSLGLAGRYSKAASAEFQELADQLQRTTTVDDGVVLGLEALAVTYTKTNAEALKLTRTSVNLAAVTGQDVNTSLQQLAGTLSGTSGRLTKLFPDLKQFTEAQLKAGAAVDYFNSRFAGAAEAQANTFDGRIIQATHAFDDLLKALGRYVTQSPVIVSLVKLVATELGRLSDLLNAKRTGDFLGGIVKQALFVAEAVNTYLITPFEVFANLGIAVVRSIVTGLRVIGTPIILVGEALFELAKIGANVIGGLYDLITGKISFKDFAKNLDESLKNVDLSATKTALEGISDSANSTATAFLSIGQTPIADALGAELAKASDVAATAGDVLKNNIKNTVGDIKKTVVDISKVIQDGLVKVIVSAFSQLGTQLAKGKFVFKDFAGAILGIVGDIAIQIGTTLIGIGLAVESIKLSLGTLTGGPALAAGIALVALGGLLKSLSGSGTQGATSGSVASSGGGGFVATDPAASTPDVTDPTESKQAAITVNIQGDVLDSKETGMRIIDIINESFNSTGAKVLAV